MKILVFSNDEMERSVIRQVVQHNGHEVITAGNSDEALQLLQKGGIRFVIVDRSTTDMDEKQFIKRLRDSHPSRYIYVLLIASRAQDMDITIPRGGADDYLHKPVVPLELKSRVHLGQRMLGMGDNLVSAKNALEKTAMFDTLTGTLNETAFLALSHGEMERARRDQSPFSMIAFEIDNLKNIRDKHGEAIGNDVLVLIAQTIREKSRPYDGVGRHENNIFLVSLPGVIGQDAEKIAERILRGILNTNITLLDGTALDIKISAGIVSSIRVTIATEVGALARKAMEAALRARQEAGDTHTHTIFL